MKACPVHSARVPCSHSLRLCQRGRSAAPTQDGSAMIGRRVSGLTSGCVRQVTHPAREFEQIKESPTEGVFVHGLFLDGCAWSGRENKLVDAEPKKLFNPLPVLSVTGVLVDPWARVLGGAVAAALCVSARAGWASRASPTTTTAPAGPTLACAPGSPWAWDAGEGRQKVGHLRLPRVPHEAAHGPQLHHHLPAAHRRGPQQVDPARRGAALLCGLSGWLLCCWTLQGLAGCECVAAEQAPRA